MSLWSSERVYIRSGKFVDCMVQKRNFFRSFRHWSGTMVAYHANGNMLVVKKALRHKQIASSMKYVSDINFEEDDFETATATTVDEAKKLAEAGFQKFDEFNSIHIYRRPKRFKH